MNFKTGDIVELKSGGPYMTVEKTYESGSGKQGNPTRTAVSCKWFQTESFIKDSFYPEMLKKTDS
jgi:uncharacterized protein YodC (DUF2158 family)